MIKIYDNELDALMFGIFKGIKEINELTLEALKALQFSSLFIVSKMESEQVSDFIYEALIVLLRNARTAKDIEIMTQGINCINEICEGTFH